MSDEMIGVEEPFARAGFSFLMILSKTILLSSPISPFYPPLRE